MEVFVKKLNADGTEVLDDKGAPVFEAVNTDTLDIKDHPQAKKLLDEAVKYRKQLAAAKKAASEEGEPSGDGEGQPAKKVNTQTEPEAEKPHIPTVDEIATELEKRAAKKAEEATQAQNAWDAKVDAAMSKHKLPDSQRTVVALSRDPEAMAEALAKAPLTFATTPSGGKSEKEEIADMWGRIDDRLGLGDKKK